MKKIFIVIVAILIAVINIFVVFHLCSSIFKNGTLKVNSEVSKNTAKVFFKVSWLDKPIEVVINDENGIKLSKKNKCPYGDLKVGRLWNVDLNSLDHHFNYFYKDQKVWIIQNYAQLNGKDVDINKPITIYIKSNESPQKTQNAQKI